MVQLKFTPFPDISTERLSLRQLKIEDEIEIFMLRSDKRILKYLDLPITKSIDDARKFIEKINNGIFNNEWMYWGITIKSESKLIGTICLWNISKETFKADIGFVLHPDFQGIGIMQEALVKVVKYGFEIMELNCIDAEVDPKNLKSINLLEKNKFHYKSKSENTVIYSLIN